MSKSAAGTADAPGRNIRAKSGLNKSILDQGWFEFRRQLEYKLAWKGGHLVVVPPQNTSRTCPCCGHISADNRRTQARFECVECGFEDNADVVGAINILSRGMQLLRDEGRDTPGWPVDRTTQVVGSRNQPKCLGPPETPWNPRPSGRGGCQSLVYPKYMIDALTIFS